MPLTYGVELEGAWDYDPNRRFSIYSDGSVRFRDDDDDDDEIGQVGETNTGICQNPRELFASVRDRYPDRVNSTCGLHLHIGGTPAELSQIGSESNYRHVMAELGNLARNRGDGGYYRLAERLKGYNSYCATTYMVPEHLRGSGERYYALNGRSYSEYQTLEFRILPMFDSPSNAIKALQTIINICVPASKKAMRTIRIKECA